jgi:hypothetical protein
LLQRLARRRRRTRDFAVIFKTVLMVQILSLRSCREAPQLVIDFTGVGRPVFDMFIYSGISPIGVLITGGTAETRDGPTCSVPKLTLVSRLRAAA